QLSAVVLIKIVSQRDLASRNLIRYVAFEEVQYSDRSAFIGEIGIVVLRAIAGEPDQRRQPAHRIVGKGGLWLGRLGDLLRRQQAPENPCPLRRARLARQAF